MHFRERETHTRTFLFIRRRHVPVIYNHSKMLDCYEKKRSRAKKHKRKQNIATFFRLFFLKKK